MFEDSLYSPEIKQLLSGLDWPKGLVFDLIEYEYHLAIRFYRDNFNSFDGEDQYQIAMMIKEAMEKIRASGVPIYMEVEAGVPKQFGA